MIIAQPQPVACSTIGVPPNWTGPPGQNPGAHWTEMRPQPVREPVAYSPTEGFGGSFLGSQTHQALLVLALARSLARSLPRPTDRKHVELARSLRVSLVRQTLRSPPAPRPSACVLSSLPSAPTPLSARSALGQRSLGVRSALARRSLSVLAKVDRLNTRVIENAMIRLAPSLHFVSLRRTAAVSVISSSSSRRAHSLSACVQRLCPGALRPCRGHGLWRGPRPAQCRAAPGCWP